MLEKPTDPFVWEHDAYHNNYQNCGLTGYTGLDYHTVAQLSVMPAWRAQVGQRGFYKAGLALMTDGTLLASPVDMLAPRVKPPFSSGLVESTWPVKLHFERLPDRTLLTIYALTPYHIEPAETGTSVCHTVRWELPVP